MERARDEQSVGVDGYVRVCRAINTRGFEILVRVGQPTDTHARSADTEIYFKLRVGRCPGNVFVHVEPAVLVRAVGGWDVA